MDMKELNSLQPNEMAEVQKKSKAKWLTFFSGVISLLLAVALIICVGYIIGYVIPNFIEQGNNDAATGIAMGLVAVIFIPLMFAFIAISLTVSICYIILGIMLIISAFKSDNVYNNRKGFVIFTIVSDFILMALMVFIAIAFNENIRVLFIAIAVLMLFSAVIKIVDLVISNRRVKSEKADIKVQPSQNVTSNSDFDALSRDDDIPSTKNLEEELKKLEELKASGLITEDEYKNMRQKLLDEVK